MNLTLRSCGEKRSFGLILQLQFTKSISTKHNTKLSLQSTPFISNRPCRTETLFAADAHVAESK